MSRTAQEAPLFKPLPLRSAQEFDLLISSIQREASTKLIKGDVHPIGIGLTRLSKTETLSLESRHQYSSPDKALAWIQESLRVRIRARQYVCAAYATLTTVDERSATIRIHLERASGVTRLCECHAKQKRRGVITFGLPTLGLAPPPLFSAQLKG